MWVAQLQSLLNLSQYSWFVMFPSLKFNNSWAFASLISIGENLSRKVSLKQSQVIGAASITLFSFHWVYQIWATSFGWYDVNSTRSFPLTYITSKIFLISSKKLWRSSIVYDSKNSGGLILTKSWTLYVMDQPFSFTWAWTWLFWLATFIDNIQMAFLNSALETF